MASGPYKCRLFLAGVLMTLGSFGELEPSVSAAPAKSKKEAKAPVVQTPVLNRPVPTTRQKVDARKLSRTESDWNVAAKAQGQTPSDRAPLKIRRHQKTRGKLRSQAIVESKPNLSYYGILEQPQRYDPSRDRRTGRAPNPQAGELLHDHFQELDKNHDGMIDPFERAVSRLDIDRDLSNRQWE